MGMQKFGTSRSDLERRMMVQINDCIRGFDKLAKQTSPSDPRHILQHTLGNMMNDIVFGETYDEDNETWTYLKNLQEEGVKYIGVSGPVNFLPFLRYK
jgi:ecdysteroid 25-hydroxylase